MKKIITALFLALGLVAVPSIANAAGSDNPTPYTLSVEGITLPSGDTFQDNGHVNIRYTQGVNGAEQGAGIHFESLNWPDDHPKKFYIGKDFIPWTAFGLEGEFCVTWVQISQYNEHYGEGQQKPVCVTPPVTCEDDPTQEGCDIPTQPESWTTEQERTLDPVCVVPANGKATVTVEKRTGVKDYIWNAETWTWNLPLDWTWSDWTVVSTSEVETEDCEPLAETGGEAWAAAGIALVLMTAGGGLLLARRKPSRVRGRHAA